MLDILQLMSICMVSFSINVAYMLQLQHSVEDSLSTPDVIKNTIRRLGQAITLIGVVGLMRPRYYQKLPRLVVMVL